MISALTESVRSISSRTSGDTASIRSSSLAAASSARHVHPADGAVVDDQAPAAVLLRLDPPRRTVAEIVVHPLVPEVVRLVNVRVR